MARSRRATKTVGRMPPLRADCDSLESYNAWVARLMVAGKIKPVLGRELLKASAQQNNVQRTRSGLNEMDQLRELVKRAEAAVAAQTGEAVKGRYGKGEIGEFNPDEPADEATKPVENN